MALATPLVARGPVTLEMADLRVLIAAHLADVYMGPQALVDVAASQGAGVVAAFAPLTINQTRLDITVTAVEGDRRRLSWTLPGFRGVGAAAYLVDPVITFAGFARGGRLVRRPRTLFVAASCFDYLVAPWLRRFGLADWSVFYPFDYSEQRFLSKFANDFYQRLYAYAVRDSDFIWNCGSAKLEQVFLRMGATPDKILKVPLGFRTPPPRQRTPGPFTVIFGGHLVESSGIEAVLQAMALLGNELPDLRFIIVGDGPCRSQQEALARELGLAGRTQFLGYLLGPEYLEQLTRADIGMAVYVPDQMMLHEFAERPNKISEYFGCGLPVVTTKMVGVHREIGRMPAGAVVEPTPESVAAALRRLATDRALLERCRENVRELRRGYDWDTIYRRAIAATTAFPRHL